jgi:hypothetical protein
MEGIREMITDTTKYNNITKDFIFVVDPSSLIHMNSKLSLEATARIKHLSEISNVNVQLILPKYLSDASLPRDSAIMGIMKVLSKGPPAIFKFDKVVEAHKEFGILPEMKRELGLLALAKSALADAIVTDSKPLIRIQYVIDQYQRIRIIPLDEFLDIINIVAVGNSVFWSPVHFREIGFDIFYQMTHWKASRLFAWVQIIAAKGIEKALDQNLRTALLNRFPYILYSRDMVRFYQLQRDYYARRERLQMFNSAIGFYINTFYLMLWGMLDQLTIIAKYARNLRINERWCGIRRKNFWKEFGAIENELTAFIMRQDISEWISIMADMRHKAAHNTISIPSVLLSETADSKRSDDEIVQILKKEKPLLYRFLDSETIEAQQTLWIQMWRVQKMEVVAPGMVMGVMPDGRTYMRDPVISVDYDLFNLIAIMDAFLVKLFG